MKKKAFITGILGQDGGYLAQYLLENEYEVHGLMRPTTTERWKEQLESFGIDDQVIYHQGDMVDGNGLQNIILKIAPDEIYNLAAQSHVHTSFQMPEYTTNVNALGALKILEIVRQCELPTKIYQASTSEMFGGRRDVFGNSAFYSEDHEFDPRSPYAISKLMAHNFVKNYREAYGIFAVSGILFNHESPWRGPNFVTKKIVRGIKRYKYDGSDFQLGNLDALRDWGHSSDYVRAMHMMMQGDTPTDYVVATGSAYSVRDFTELVCHHCDLDVMWTGADEDEVLIDQKTNNVIISIDPNLYRPTEVDALIGDSTKIRTELGWEPFYSFQELVKEMVRT